MTYVAYFLFSGLCAVLLTPIVKRFAIWLGCVDMPGLARKVHSKPVPFMGGLAVFLTLLFGMCIYAWVGAWDFITVPAKFAFGTALGGLVLMVGGFFDDRYSLPAKVTWIFPAIAAALVMRFGVGVGITFLTNPFGGEIPLTAHILGFSLSTLFVWFWIMGMTYTTKLLDGLDGLAAGVSLIGGLTMFFLSLTTKINQPVTATLAILFAGALAGYLVYAFNPASIFLGEGGSTFLGFFLAVLSVLTGAKIATAVLVMGIPIFDVAWAIVRRIIRGHSPFRADREHLHHLLLDAGLSQRQVVLVFYAFAAGFGFFAVFLQSLGKVLALGLLLVVMVGLLGFLASVYRNRKIGPPHI